MIMFASHAKKNLKGPQVIFNITTVEDEDGVLRYKRTCVDGKQVALQQSCSTFLADHMTSVSQRSVNL